MRLRDVYLPLALAMVTLTVVVGCGGVDESNFAPTQGSPDPGAAKTPAEVDARLPNRNI